MIKYLATKARCLRMILTLFLGVKQIQLIYCFKEVVSGFWGQKIVKGRKKRHNSRQEINGRRTTLLLIELTIPRLLNAFSLKINVSKPKSRRSFTTCFTLLFLQVARCLAHAQCLPLLCLSDDHFISSYLAFYEEVNLYYVYNI